VWQHRGNIHIVPSPPACPRSRSTPDNLGLLGHYERAARKVEGLVGRMAVGVRVSLGASLRFLEPVRIQRAGVEFGDEMLERWRKRGLICVTKPRSVMRRVRADEVAPLAMGRFTGFAPMRQDADIVRVPRVRPIE
jgi:hypothetical protein